MVEPPGDGIKLCKRMHVRGGVGRHVCERKGGEYWASGVSSNEALLQGKKKTITTINAL